MNEDNEKNASSEKHKDRSKKEPEFKPDIVTDAVIDAQSTRIPTPDITPIDMATITGPTDFTMGRQSLLESGMKHISSPAPGHYPMMRPAESRNKPEVESGVTFFPWPEVPVPLKQLKEYGSKGAEEFQYRLKIDGDALEKEAWDSIIHQYFPYYELFWQKFVVPRTNRPHNIRTKEDTPERERYIIMLHYSILTNFLDIYQNLPYAYNRGAFEGMYVRLSSVTDVCEEFLFWFYLWVRGKSISEALNDEEIKTKFITPDEGKAVTLIPDEGKAVTLIPDEEKAVKQLKKGRNYSLPVVSKRDIIRLLAGKTLGDELYDEVFNPIRTYRNFIVHSWPMFQIGWKFPQKDAVSKNRDWVELLKDLDDPSKSDAIYQDKYEDMAQMVQRDFLILISTINRVWTVVLEELDNKNS